MGNGDSEQFSQDLDSYKNMVILRQDECVQIAELLEIKARNLSRRAMQFKIALIVLGVIVATKGGLEAAMFESDAGTTARVALGLVFLVLGAVIAIIAGVEAGFRFESRAGEIRSLSGLCRSYDRRFMSDYKKHIDPSNPEITVAKLESLVDLQNDALVHIRDRSDHLGIDLSTVNISYRVGDLG
jgi:hypothetical protein